MARLGDNPVYNPPPANGEIPFEDPTSGDDFTVTPEILTQYAQDHMGVANGSTNGLMTGPQSDKLNALDTQAQLDAIFTQLRQFPFPIFIASPVDGFVEVYRNVLDNPVEFDFMWFQLSSGSTNLTVKLDGVPVTGWTNVNITTASSGTVATALKTLAAGSILGLQFFGSSSPQNLRLTLKGDVTLL